MKNLIFLVLIIVCGGCAATLPPTAPTAPEAGISISTASLEAAENFSLFLCPMNDSLWAQEADSPGQSPVFGETKNGEIIEGFWFRIGMGKRGLPLLLAVFPGSFSGKFIYLSRDGFDAFGPTGEPIKDFDGEKFGKDGSYRDKILSEYGEGEEDLKIFWKSYFVFHRDILPEDFSPVSFISRKELEEVLEGIFSHKYQMPSGEERLSNLPPSSFKKEAIQNTAITPKDKFLKHFRVGIPLDPLSGGLMAGSAVLNGMIGTASEKYPVGYYGSALVQRKELGPTFEKLARKYRQLLLERAEWERAFLIELRKEGVSEEIMRRVLMKIGLP